jgi:hypothetical protein
LFSWSTHLSGSFPKVWNLHELFELGMKPNPIDVKSHIVTYHIMDRSHS